mgnify:CR=1 FL=1
MLIENQPLSPPCRKPIETHIDTGVCKLITVVRLHVGSINQFHLIQIFM